MSKQQRSAPKPIMMNAGNDFSPMDLATSVKPAYGSSSIIVPGNQYANNQAPPALSQTINPAMAKPGPHIFRSMNTYVPPPPTLPVQVPTPQPVQISPPTSVQQVISTVHHHLIGSQGWQKLSGYVNGTDLQPILLLKSGNISGMSLSYVGTKSLTGPIYICKNFGSSEVPTESSDKVIAIITFSNTETFDFTIVPGEKLEKAEWKSITNVVNRNDKISVYGSDLTDANLELFFELKSTN